MHAQLIYRNLFIFVYQINTIIIISYKYTNCIIYNIKLLTLNLQTRVIPVRTKIYLFIIYFISIKKLFKKINFFQNVLIVL